MQRIFWNTFILVATVWGVISAAISVFQVTQSAALAGAVVAVTFMAALVASSVPLFIYLNSLRSGYPGYQTRSFISKRKSKIVIDENFKAVIENVRDYVFFSEPNPRELIDMYDTLKGFSFSPSAYVSTDSRVVEHVALKPHVMAIQWEPRKPIIPLVPYRHHTRNTSPSLPSAWGCRGLRGDLRDL